MHQNDISISGGGSGAPAGAGGGGSRWNPTKEQIDMLEGVYRQGIRTPSAEQIEEITDRLRAFGHIEGKNVFYWFQNHKARQRQKQKQDHLSSYFNHFLHHTSPPCPNVVCSPLYIPQADLGLYNQHQQQQPKIILRRRFKRRPMVQQVPEKVETTKNKFCGGAGEPPEIYNYAPQNQDYSYHHHVMDINSGRRSSNVNIDIMSSHSCINDDDQQTLDLFPLHPSGSLHESTKSAPSSSPNPMADVGNSTAAPHPSTSTSSSFDNRRFIDFFCGNGP